MNRIIALVSFLFLVSCHSEPVSIYSSIDARDHEKILNGPMNSKRAALELIYEKEEIDKDWFNSLVDNLGHKEKSWRSVYFKALSYYCNSMTNEEEAILQTALFDFFIYHPKEYMQLVRLMDIDKSDCYLQLFSSSVKNYIETGEITVVSMKNVAYKYCYDCTDQDIKMVYSYLELAAIYQLD